MVSTAPIKCTNMKDIVSDSKKFISLIREIDTHTKSHKGGPKPAEVDIHRDPGVLRTD